jgi:hypothetical protein
MPSWHYFWSFVIKKRLISLSLIAFHGINTSVSAKIQCVRKYILAVLQRQVSNYSKVGIVISESVYFDTWRYNACEIVFY